MCKSILKPIIQLFFLLTEIQWAMFEQPRRRRFTKKKKRNKIIKRTQKERERKNDEKNK